MKQVLSFFLAAALAISMCACGTNSGSTSSTAKTEQIPQTKIKDINVTKYEADEQWVINTADSDQYMVPKFNIDSENITALNTELFDKFSKINKKQKESGYLAARFTLAKHGSLLSLLITMRERSGLIKYEAYNVSLTDGTTASDDDVIGYFGVTKTEYFSGVKEGLENEYNTYAGTFKDSCSKLYKKHLSETLNDKNVKAAKPYIGKDGSLSFISQISDLDDVPKACAVAAMAPKNS